MDQFLARLKFIGCCQDILPVFGRGVGRRVAEDISVAADTVQELTACTYSGSVILRIDLQRGDNCTLLGAIFLRSIDCQINSHRSLEVIVHGVRLLATIGSNGVSSGRAVCILTCIEHLKLDTGINILLVEVQSQSVSAGCVYLRQSYQLNTCQHFADGGSAST